jgi:hypothetical protein
MARFEVFVPAAPPRLPAAVTLRVDAENWLAALKAGLGKTGGGEVGAHLLCDIQADGSIHVTGPSSAGVFRIREMEEAPAPVAARVEEVPGPSGPRQPARIGRPAPETRAEDALAEVFQRAGEVHARRNRDDGLGFLLDLAMEKIRCEAGSVFLARLGSGDLAFAVARGPKAEEIRRLGIRVPMGAGIVGFCTQENVCLAVSDAERDARFYRRVSEAIGYATRSLLCAPIGSAGQVHGALELVNKADGAAFDRSDVAIASYLAHEAGSFLARLGA